MSLSAADQFLTAGLAGRGRKGSGAWSAPTSLIQACRARGFVWDRAAEEQGRFVDACLHPLLHRKMLAEKALKERKDEEKTRRDEIRARFGFVPGEDQILPSELLRDERDPLQFLEPVARRVGWPVPVVAAGGAVLLLGALAVVGYVSRR